MTFTRAERLSVDAAGKETTHANDHAVAVVRQRSGRGVSWQVVPERLFELLSDPDTARAEAKAVLGMRKIVIADLEAAAANP